MQSAYAKTPLTRSPGREKLVQRPTVYTQFESAYEAEKSESKLRETLDSGWAKAVARFQEITGRDLVDLHNGKEGVLSTLQRMYDSDNKEAAKNDELWSTMSKVLNGVEVVGGIAAQVGGMFFAPAGLCFNAIEMLINIPQQFKELKDGLQALFNEVMSFLANFKILQRTDARIGLDEALVLSTNKILQALVEVCALSIRVRKHRFRTMMSTIFLKDDKVKDALANFKHLVDEQTKLTATVTLEAVLQTRDTTTDLKRQNERIEYLSRETQEGVKDLIAYNADSKNFKATQETILRIDKALGLPEGVATKPLQTLDECHKDLLDETADHLAKNAIYQEWNKSKARRKLLYLYGNPGTGKTYLLAALQRSVEDAKSKLKSGEHSIYLAYYAFSRSDDGRQGAESPFHKALKYMACQVARQSTKYAEAMKKDVDSFRNLERLSLKDLWDKLKFETFPAVPNSIFYLLFDGLDQLKSDLKEFDELLRLTVQSRHRTLKDDAKLRFRIILTGNMDSLDGLETNITTVPIRSINDGLMLEFVKTEMKRMDLLQHRHSTIVPIKQSKNSDVLTSQYEVRKQKLIDEILNSSGGSFASVAQKLTIVRDAIDDDLDFEELLHRIDNPDDSSWAQEGARILEAVCQRVISPVHREQLKELLIWASYGWRRPSLPELEAVLYLQRKQQSLEPLERKISTRFEGALTIGADGLVMANFEVEQYVTSLRSSLPSKEAPPKVTINFTIENSDGPIVRQLFLQLNTAVSEGKFDLASQLEDRKLAEYIDFFQVAYAEGHFTIAMRCLQALNDDTIREKTEPLMEYATQSLPEHLYYLNSADRIKELSPTQRRILGQSLVDFLSDFDNIDKVWRVKPLYSRAWVNDTVNVKSIAGILKNELVLEALEPRNKRWALKHTKQQTGNRVPFLEPLALVAASHWLQHQEGPIIDAVQCYEFVNDYLDLNEDENFMFDSPPLSYRTSSSISGRSHRRRSRRRYRSSRSPSRSPLRSPSRSSSRRSSRHSSKDNSPIATRSSSPARSIAEMPKRHSDLNSGDAHEDVTGSMPTEHDIVESNSNQNGGSGPVSLPAANGKVQNPQNEVTLDEQIKNDILKTPEEGIEEQAVEVQAVGEAENVLDSQAINGDGSRHSDNESTRSRYLSFQQRVERAKKWAIAKLSISADSYVHRRLGQTYAAESDLSAAIQCYLDAQNYLQSTADFHNTLKEEIEIAMDLAQAHSDKQEEKQACEALLPVIKKLREQRNENLSDAEEQDRKNSLYKVLKQAVPYYISLEENATAIEMLSEAIGCDPVESDCRYGLFKLLCTTDQHSKALEALDEWSKVGEQDPELAPAAYFLKILQNDHDTLQKVVYPALGTEIHDRIVEILRSAIDAIPNVDSSEDAILFHFALGLALAATRDEQKVKLAAESWESCINISFNLRLANEYPCTQSSNLCARYYFDSTKKEYMSRSDWTNEQKVELFDQLRETISTILTPSQKWRKAADTPMAYAVAFSSFVKLKDHRAIMKSDVADALDILTNEDPDDDNYGLSMLFRALFSCGDYVGASSVWSFFDRGAQAAKRKELKEAAQTNGDKDKELAKGASPENTSSHSQDADQANDAAPKTTFFPDDNYYTFTCDGCGEYWSSNEGKDLWLCKFCPDCGFCKECYRKLRERSLQKLICSHEHSHALIKHFDYDEEEVKDQNVLIEWELKESNDGCLRERVGGRIVTLREWVDILRKEWDITESASEGRLQK